MAWLLSKGAAMRGTARQAAIISGKAKKSLGLTAKLAQGRIDDHAIAVGEGEKEVVAGPVREGDTDLDRPVVGLEFLPGAGLLIAIPEQQARAVRVEVPAGVFQVLRVGDAEPGAEAPRRFGLEDPRAD